MTYFSPNHGSRADTYFAADNFSTQDQNHQTLLERAAQLIAAALLAGWDQYREPVMRAINEAPWENMPYCIDLTCEADDTEGAFDDFCGSLPFDDDFDGPTDKAWEIFHAAYLTYDQKGGA